MLPRFRNSGHRKKRKDFFLRNGAAILEQAIRSVNGDCNPIRSYSAQELKKATSDFRWMIHNGWNYTLHRGIHEGREISVKKFRRNPLLKNENPLERIANEVAIASRMSNHKNVLKLLGCCLETELPLLVYEFPSNGNLGVLICSEDQQLLFPFELKLRIAIQIANAVAYLHHGLSKRIIHRNIKPANIFMDQNNVAKLFDFQDAIPIPEGETHVDVTEVLGTHGFLAPEAEMRGRYAEKSDVYAFGVLLCQFLTGKTLNDFVWSHMALSDNNSWASWLQSISFREEIVAKYCEIVCGQEENRAQVLEYVKVFQSCVKENPDDRPNMVEVEKALRLIIKTRSS